VPNAQRRRQKRVLILRHVLEAELRHDQAEGVAQPCSDQASMTPAGPSGLLETEQHRDPIARQLEQLAGDYTRIELPEDLRSVSANVFDLIDRVEPCPGASLR
jgi:hypothetical protein